MKTDRTTLHIVLDYEKRQEGDRVAVRPDQPLSGRVWVHINQTVQGRYLNLDILGKEERWVQSTRGSDVEHRTLTARYGLRKLISEELQPGWYGVPFNLKRPAMLPGSEVVSGEGNIDGTMTYEVRATIKETSERREFTIPTPSYACNAVPRLSSNLAGSPTSRHNREAEEHDIGRTCQRTPQAKLAKTVSKKIPSEITIPSWKLAPEAGTEDIGSQGIIPRGSLICGVVKDRTHARHLDGQNNKEKKSEFRLTNDRARKHSKIRCAHLHEGVSLKRLLDEMISSGDGFRVISQKINDEMWRELLASVNANEYGCIVAHVKEESDRPRLATLLAPLFKNGFSCEYAASAIRKTRFRVSMAHRLIPFCIDVAANIKLIKNELNEWDLNLLSRITNVL